MSFVIDEEAYQNRLSPFSIDKMGDRYITETKIFTFPSPMLRTIEKNLYYLLRNSTRKVFESKYIMRPDYLSFDEYETVVLAPLLMYINGVFCVEEFSLNEVVIPEFSSVIQILDDNFPDKPVNQLEEASW